MHPDAQLLLARMALVSYGTVQGYNTRTINGNGNGGVKPSGEGHPMHERWAAIFAATGSEEDLRDLLTEAQAELDAWQRRPLAPDTTETLEELSARIVRDGWAITPDECAIAMRCTPTLVRRVRLAADRHPETGYHLPAKIANPMSWARMLDSAGLSLRQIETITGVPKSTLHDRLNSRPRRTARAGG